jgi:3-phenylpropionate/trans-cinnamate dioxygenase ferredoxin reductase component
LLIAGLMAAGYRAAWDMVPGFFCAIGEFILKYRGWGTGYEHSRLVDNRNGVTAWYESGGEVVGMLSLNADDDYRRADGLLRARASRDA